MATTTKPKTTKPKTNEGKVTVRFTGMVRGSYGAYDVNDVAEIDSALYESLKSAGVVELCDKTEEKTEEDFI